MNDFIKENKSKLIIILVVIILTIALTIYNSISKKGGNKVSSNDRESYVMQLAQTYYEEAVYPKLDESLIDDISDDPIRLNLRELIGKFEDGVDTSIFFTKKDSCDLVLSYVVITPFGYDLKDYTVTVELVCNDIIIED